MKCEKCGKEASFHYQSNINGEKAEYHLCNECARAEGFGNVMSFTPRSMFDGFWSDPFERSMVDSFFGRPFGMMNRLMGSVMAPVFALPSISVVVGDPQTSTAAESENTDNIPEDAGEDIRLKRELTGLRHQLRAAVNAEEFEKAAELRDKIRELEK